MGRGAVIAIRAVSPRDMAAFREFVRALSPGARYHRFLAGLQDLTPALARLLTQPPGERHLGLVALDGGSIVGEARYAVEEPGGPGELAIVVADPWQRRGVGSRMLAALRGHARAHQVRRLVGEVAATNAGMLAFARKAGFRVRPHPGDARLSRIEIDLAPTA